jgi:hypothetical protein
MREIAAGGMQIMTGRQTGVNGEAVLLAMIFDVNHICGGEQLAQGIQDRDLAALSVDLKNVYATNANAFEELSRIEQGYHLELSGALNVSRN